MTMLRKGYFEPDGTYRYTCGCGYRDGNCPFCYGGNLDKCRVAIKTARGQIYYGLLKTILGHIGKAIVDDARTIHRETGKLTGVDIAWISLNRDLNYKATFEWLEEVGVVYTGTYERVRGQKSVAELYRMAREKYEVPR